MLHHIVNEHVWVLAEGKADGKCHHEPLNSEERDKPWLKKNSQAHTALRKILLDKRRLNTLRYYTNFRFVYCLSTIKYCSNMVNYSPLLRYKLICSGTASSIIGGGGIFIYSCSQTLKTIHQSILKEINNAEHEYMNTAPPQNY